MKMISIYNTYYSSYQNKPRLFFQLASVTVCCFIIISLFFLKIPRITSFEGTYSCDSICKITASIPKDFFKEIHSTDTIVIDDELYLFCGDYIDRSIFRSYIIMNLYYKFSCVL